MSERFCQQLSEKTDGGFPLDESDALRILETGAKNLPAILAAASAARKNAFDQKVSFCSIVNAKNGACGEDCAFCAQSAHHQKPGLDSYGMMSAADIIAARDSAAKRPIEFFSIVTSGYALPDDEIEIACQALRRNPAAAYWCASLGCLTKTALAKLKKAGLTRYHHNLETAESFYPEVCSTHPYSERLRVIRDARAVGLQVCSGGILGLGESLEQRVELATTLQRQKVDAIPLNFHIAIPGTPLAGLDPMPPLDILLTIAMFKLVNPRAGIRIAAGRSSLRRLQSLVFAAGCDGMMIGDLLTTSNQTINDDIQMALDFGLETSRKQDND